MEVIVKTYGNIGATLEKAICDCGEEFMEREVVEEGDIIGCPSCGDEFILRWEGITAAKVYDGDEEEVVHDLETGKVKQKFKGE